MWKGLKKALGKPGKCRKSSLDKYGLDVSNRSASSAAPSSVVFPLDLDAETLAALQEQHSEHQHRQLLTLGDGRPAGPLTATQLQQQIQQQLALQRLVNPSDDHSTSKRQAAALQKRIDNAMLNPSTCLYQISSLLSLSTLFEHKLQRDAMTALQQTPTTLVSNAAAAAAAAAATATSCSRHPCTCEHSADGYPGNGASQSSCSFCPATGLQRTPSATAASTANVALQLVRWGYRVIVRKVLHSKAYWTKAMDNTFIVALDTSSGSHVEYIVDPHFKETFNVGVMSQNYSAVWHSLPQVFIGMPCQLQPVVQLLCEEMELSFLEQGRPCPPWREWAATINRWMSDQYVDILVPEPEATDGEIVEFITRCCQCNTTAVAAMGGSSASTNSSGTTSSCSPVALNQQRLQDKMHVSSVLSSSSTCSKRPVPEPLHKQLGFAAVTEDEAALLPTALRDASFTSVSSETSAASMQMLTEVQAAAAAAGKRGSINVGGVHSLSVPSAEVLSSSGSSVSGDCLLAEGASPEFVLEQQQQQLVLAGQQQQAPARRESTAFTAHAATGQRQQASERQHDVPERAKAAASAAGQLPVQRPSSGGSSSSSAVAAAGEGQVPVGRPKSKSLLTEHMQLKAMLQQQTQQGMIFPCSTSSSNYHVQQIVQPGYQLQLQALQQQQQLLQHQQVLQQQQQPQRAVQQPQHALHLQLQQQQLMQQQAALQQLQQQPDMLPLLQQQQQPGILPLLQQQQRIHVLQPSAAVQPLPHPQQMMLQQQQQQQLLGPLLPVVHTVRPCGPGQAPAVAAMAQPLQQQPLRDAQLQVVQAPVQEDQPKLLRLIHRNK